MSKPKFNPIITRIKLNPEQAVLACGCWDAGRYNAAATARVDATGVCENNASPRLIACSKNARINAAIS